MAADVAPAEIDPAVLAPSPRRQWPRLSRSRLSRSRLRKPRISGARPALEYFGLPDSQSEYAERTQQVVIALIEAGQFTAFPAALGFLLAPRGGGILVAAGRRRRTPGVC